MNRYPLSMKIAFFLLTIILFLFGIIKAKDFLYPIVIGVLFGYLFYPVVCFLEKKGSPRILASLVSIILFIAIVGTALVLLYKQAGNLLDDFPVYKSQALKNLDKLESLIEEQFGLRDLRMVEFLRDRIKYIFEVGSESMNRTFSNAAGLVFSIGMLPVYIFLFLYYRTKLAYFILQMVSKEDRRPAISILKSFSSVVARYMGGISTVVLILIILETAGLMFIGIENAFIFGIISGTCSYIPYFGSLIGGSIPFAFSLLTSNSPMVALKVALLYYIIHVIENNILSPNIVGNSLQLNPMVIILGVIAGGVVWGIPGMFAIVPLLAMVKIMSENIQRLHAYSYLLGTKGTRKHALTYENMKDFYKRLIRNLKKWFRK